VHIYHLKTCNFIKSKEAILVLFRQGVSFSRVPGAILHFFITATKTQNANFKKIKNRKQSIDAHYISISQWTTVLSAVYFWYYLYAFTLRKQSSKIDCVCFYHVITERCLPALIMYCRQFKYTCYIALVYTLKITNKKRYRMSFK